MYFLELAGEDDPFAVREAEAAAVGVDLVAPGLATAGSVDPDRVRTLAYTRAAAETVARTDASVESARLALEAASLDREGTVAVRARDVRGLAGVSTSAAERELGSVLVERGFEVDLDDPDHVLTAVFSDGERGDEATKLAGSGVCLLGWRAVESIRDYGERTPTDRPFFQPGSMAPLDARALANVAGAGPGRTLLDPMCGTGGVLIEGGLVGADVVGNDAQWKMTNGADENLRASLTDRDDDDPYDPGEFHVLRGDATDLALRDGVADSVVFDAPYGRQSKISGHRLEDLVAGALAEAHRVTTDDATAVLMADRSWRDAATAVGWRLTDLFERRVHRSLVRHVHVLEKDP